MFVVWHWQIQLCCSLTHIRAIANIIIMIMLYHQIP